MDLPARRSEARRNANALRRTPPLLSEGVRLGDSLTELKPLTIWALNSSLPKVEVRLRGFVSLMPGGRPRRFVTVQRTVHLSHAVSAVWIPVSPYIQKIPLNEEAGRGLRSTSTQSSEPCDVAQGIHNKDTLFRLSGHLYHHKYTRAQYSSGSAARHSNWTVPGCDFFKIHFSPEHLTGYFVSVWQTLHN